MGRDYWHHYSRHYLNCVGLCLFDFWWRTTNQIIVGEIIPDFTNFDNIVLAASIFLFYAGMEMNAIHVKDVENPKRNYPIAIMLAALGTVLIFVLGTLAIAFVIPQSDISLTQSLLVAYDTIFKWAGLEWLGYIVAFALAIGVLAGVVTWVAEPHQVY